MDLTFECMFLLEGLCSLYLASLHPSSFLISEQRPLPFQTIYFSCLLIKTFDTFDTFVHSLSVPKTAKKAHFSPIPWRSFWRMAYTWYLTKCQKMTALNIFRSAAQTCCWMIKAKPATTEISIDHCIRIGRYYVVYKHVIRGKHVECCNGNKFAINTVLMDFLSFGLLHMQTPR